MPWVPRMPDRTAVVALVKAYHPDEWRAMNEAGDFRFIKRLASVLHYGATYGDQRIEADPNFGLNGKRGNPHDLSPDVIAYKNPTVSFGCESADVVIAHGSPDARPGWQNITKDRDEGGTGAAWVQPERLTPTPLPDPEPDPDDGHWQEVMEAVASMRQTLDECVPMMLEARSHIAELHAEVEALTARLENLRVVGTTSREWGHGHQINLKVQQG